MKDFFNIMTKDKGCALLTAFLMTLAVIALPVAAMAQAPGAEGGGVEASDTEKEARCRYGTSPGG